MLQALPCPYCYSQPLLLLLSTLLMLQLLLARLLRWRWLSKASLRAALLHRHLVLLLAACHLRALRVHGGCCLRPQRWRRAPSCRCCHACCCLRGCWH